MTKEQEQSIEILKRQYDDSVKHYATFGSESVSSFIVCKSTIENDDNITIVVTTINKINDNLQPIIGVVNLLIQSDGNYINLMDVYPPDKVMDYLKKLKKV